MKQFLLILIGAVSFQFVGFSQKISIKDQENYQPLEYVTLYCDTTSASAVTDSKGQAEISAFKGAKEIIIRSIGFEKLVISYAKISKNGFEIYMVPSAISLDHLVISATRWSQSQREVPAKITSISAKQVALQNPQTAADLLATSGEVYIQKSQLGGGSPMIRGFATNRLLIAVDGIRMNNAIFRSGNLQNVISIDPFTVENTEISFGPGSVIYGSDAIAGVLSFKTLTPKLNPDSNAAISGKAATRYSSASSEQTGHFDVNLGWEKFAMVTSFTYSDYGDLKMGTYGPDEYKRELYVQREDGKDVVITNKNPLLQNPTGYSQTHFMQKFRFKPNKKWNFNYGFLYAATTDVPRYDRLIRTENGKPKSAEWYYGPQIWTMNNLDISHQGHNKLYDKLNVRLAHQYFEESRIDRDFNASDRTTRVEQVNAFSLNIDLKKYIGEKHQLFYGTDAVINDVFSSASVENITTGVTSNTSSRYPNSLWQSYAGYVSYHYKATSKVLIQAGARYNQFILDSKFDPTFYPFPFTEANINNQAVTGSIGARYNPNEKWTLSLNFASGFRAPNVDDVGKIFDSEPGSVVVPNPDLKAEYSYNAELSITKIFSDFLKIDLTGFYTILEDALVRRDYTFNGQDSIFYDGEMSKVQAVQNAAQATVYGLQAGLELKLPKGFSVSSRFNYQQGVEELADGTTSPLRHAAPWYGVTHLTYSVQKLKLDLYSSYSGEVANADMPKAEKKKDYLYAVDVNGNPYSPAWYSLNFKAMYQLIEFISISAGVENITDQRYRPYSSGLVASGRNFILSVRAIF
ncbi:MAG: TonB-dependent receptor [Flavobacteriales bacterium]|nr:TonB-dependent receptor [Flavobacteriales bacterium]